MELTETIAPTESTESVQIVETLADSQSESETVPVVLVDVDRPFLETGFVDYSVTEGLLLLIFLFVILDFFYNLVRR